MIRGTRIFGVAAVAGLAISTVVAGQRAVGVSTAATTKESARSSTSALAAATVVARFVGYLTTLQTPGDISREGLERSTSLRLGYIDSGARYRTDELGGGWRLIVEYFSGTKTVERNVSLEFVNERDEYANMSPVCGTEANVVRNALKKAGYEERESVGEIGNFLGWEYIRDNILISLIPQATRGQDDEPHLCVRSIRTTG